MSDPKTFPSPSLSTLPSRGDGGRRGLASIIWAGTLSLAWTGGIWLWHRAGDGADTLTTALAALVPVCGIWLGALAMRRIAVLNDRVEDLQARLGSAHHALLNLRQQAAAGSLIQAAPPAEPASVAPVPAPESSPEAGRDPGPAAEPVPEPAALPSLELADLVRAVNFPDGPDDHEGIRCLRLALQDQDAARLIRAAQDMLTLLAQDGIYTDDLTLLPIDAAPWRALARGARASELAGLRCIDPDAHPAEQIVRARLGRDEVFRDAAHHFMRQLDRMVQAHEERILDEELLALAQTRTGRAYMLSSQSSAPAN